MNTETGHCLSHEEYKRWEDGGTGRMGGCGKQTALRWFCEARRSEFLHGKWIPLKAGFKTYFLWDGGHPTGRI